MTLTCNRTDCTLSQTGTCMFDRDPELCEDRLASLNSKDKVDSVKSGSLLDPVLESPTEVERFRASYTLSVAQAEQLMRERYCRIVGILGSPGVGKTACLVSLHLLLSHGRLNGYTFRDSKTLRALEEISRGARRWDEANSPDQLTLHTEIQDQRTAGFLHFRLNQNSSGNSFDLLLPDLPGEWTTTLIDGNRTDRLAFLRSAESLLLFVSGDELIDDTKRRLTIHRLNLLLDRLEALCNTEKPAIILVVTHADTYQIEETHITKFIAKAKSLEFVVSVSSVASFSSKDNIEPGHGIANLINQIFTNNSNGGEQAFWPECHEHDGKRQFYNFGKE